MVLSILISYKETSIIPIVAGVIEVVLIVFRYLMFASKNDGDLY